jgi:hypothetical protein
MSDIVAFLYSNAWRIAGVVAVVVLATVAAVIGHTANFAANLAATDQGVANLYDGQSTFSSLTTAIAARYAPTAMQGTGGTLITPWNGTVTWAPDSNTSERDITVTNVPVSQCTNLANALGGVLSETVNGTTLTNSGSGIDAGSLSNACGDTGTVTLVYVLGK